MTRVIELLRANRNATGAAIVVAALGLVGAVTIGLPPPLMIVLLIALGLTTWGTYRWRTRRLEVRPVHVPPGILTSSALVAAVVVFVAAQAVPYGRDHTNPPVTGEPIWATPETRELMARACFDCHSNQVEWPWYSNVAPLSWAVAKHVADGRHKVNYQEWDQPQREAEESYNEVVQGSMPPRYYTLGGLHAAGRLTAVERNILQERLSNTPGLSE